MQIGQIVAGCASAYAALGTDSTGQLTMLAATSPADPNALWQIDQGFDPQGVPLGAVFKHQVTGNYLTARPDGGLVLCPLSQFDGWSTWTFGGPISDRYAAVRPFNDDDLNLNVLGGCGNTSVGLWQWGGGDSNEIWMFFRDSRSSPPPTQYIIRSGCPNIKGIHIPLMRGPNNTVTIGGSFDTEDGIWNVEVAVSKEGWLMGGISIVSAKTGQAIRCLGSNTQVGFGDATNLDAYSAWTIGGSSQFVALRPLVDDDQNLNVQGGCAGSGTVCTWTWSGGDPNEIWMFEKYWSPVAKPESDTRESETNAPPKAETW